MARPNTGSVEARTRKNGTLDYFGRILLADGSRARTKPIPPKFCKDAETRKAWVEQAQLDEHETGAMLAMRKKKLAERAAKNSESTRETCTQYRQRLNVKQAADGEHGAVHAAQGNWPNWIEEELGNLPISAPFAVLRPRCLAVLKKLNDQVRLRNAAIEQQAEKEDEQDEDEQDEDEQDEDEQDDEQHLPGIAGKTAWNVWTTLTKTFSVACQEGEDPTMHVRDDNPCANIAPPLKTPVRTKTFLYPVEFLLLICCERIPLCWRVLYTLLFYLYTRPSELRALKQRNVDLVADLVHVTRGYDARRKTMKATTKTRAGVRPVPVEARMSLALPPNHPYFLDVETLRPLLAILKAHGKDSDRLMPLLARPCRWPAIFRAHLKLAGIMRRELHRNTTTTVRANQRTGRDSGITWLALLKIGTESIKRRAGHDAWETSEGYVKMAEDFTGGRIGVPFPPLPSKFLADVEAALCAGTLYADIHPGVQVTRAAARPRLTHEQMETVAKLHADGRSQRQIAATLGVSRDLVRGGLKRIPFGQPIGHRPVAVQVSAQTGGGDAGLEPAEPVELAPARNESTTDSVAWVDASLAPPSPIGPTTRPNSGDSRCVETTVIGMPDHTGEQFESCSEPPPNVQGVATDILVDHAAQHVDGLFDAARNDTPKTASADVLRNVGTLDAISAALALLQHAKDLEARRLTSTRATLTKQTNDVAPKPSSHMVEEEAGPGMGPWCPAFTVLWDENEERTIASWDKATGPTPQDIVVMAGELTPKELAQVLAYAA